jgi:hypothetical protein
MQASLRTCNSDDLAFRTFEIHSFVGAEPGPRPVINRKLPNHANKPQAWQSGGSCRATFAWLATRSHALNVALCTSFPQERHTLFQRWPLDAGVHGPTRIRLLRLARSNDVGILLDTQLSNCSVTPLKITKLLASAFLAPYFISIPCLPAAGPCPIIPRIEKVTAPHFHPHAGGRQTYEQLLPKSGGELKGSQLYAGC